MGGTYVMRPVLHPERILSWAWRQGLRWSLELADLHVTVMYSETEVTGLAADTSQLDMQIREARIARFGSDATVLEILDGAQVLHARHEEMLAHGGTRTFPTYRPHVTLTYRGPARPRTSRFEGRLQLGPEVWQPLDQNAQDRFVMEMPLRRHDLAARRRLAWEIEK